MQSNIVPHQYGVKREDRNKANGHNSFLIWFTGLSGSGKSTIANAVEEALFNEGLKTYVLDGDNIRAGICKDLTFSIEDRTENIRRIAEISKLMIDAGLIVLAAFVSPLKKDRENIRSIVNPNNFVEVFVSTSLEECERRDVKGLYKKARAGEIKDMTGISSPYEAPEHADVTVDTEEVSVEEAVATVIKAIKNKIKATPTSHE